MAIGTPQGHRESLLLPVPVVTYTPVTICFRIRHTQSLAQMSQPKDSAFACVTHMPNVLCVVCVQGLAGWSSDFMPDDPAYDQSTYYVDGKSLNNIIGNTVPAAYRGSFAHSDPCYSYPMIESRPLICCV